jgi:hypothetical protein
LDDKTNKLKVLLRIGEFDKKVYEIFSYKILIGKFTNITLSNEIGKKQEL